MNTIATLLIMMVLSQAMIQVSGYLMYKKGTRGLPDLGYLLGMFFSTLLLDCSLWK